MKQKSSDTGRDAQSGNDGLTQNAEGQLVEQDFWCAKNRWLWLGCVLLVIVAALQSANRSVGGGDTWVAMANGRYTMGPWAQQQENRTWQMKVLDVFGIHMTYQDYMGAMTRGYDPADPEKFGWVNQNWLTHVMFYNMREAWGENSIVIYKFIQAILTALFAYWAGRKLGAHPVLAAATAAFGMLLSRSFIDLRPNQSTIFYAAAMMMVLAHWLKGRPRAILWLIPIMMMWSNVHGGFIYAMMVLAVVLAGHAVQNYLGKYAQWFVLLGGIVAIALLVRGIAGLQSEVTLRQSTLAECRPWQIAGGVAIGAIVLLEILALIRIVGSGFADFVMVGNRKFKWLIGGGAIVVLVPAIFTPFGIENVLHPLVIALGEEGDIWRRVVEWRPIWDKQGFGEAGPYSYFLCFFALVWFVWWLLVLSRPTSTDSARRSRRKSDPLNDIWPKIDIAAIGVIAITLIMSIKSRRFIFLGGVILAPFLAQMAQEIASMWKMLRKHSEWRGWAFVAPACSLVLGGLIGWAAARELFIPWLSEGDVSKILGYAMGTVLAFLVMFGVWFAWEAKLNKRVLVTGVSLLSWVAVALLGAIFAGCMWDVYYRPATDGRDLTVFRRMVGIPAQPVDAIKFFDDNHLEGIVFNEWVNGGFITFWQTPQESNGQALCKVYMDGRAQAAYSLYHFQRWTALKSVNLPPNDHNVQVRLRELARARGISNDGTRDFYDRLLLASAVEAETGTPASQTGNPALQTELISLIGQDRDLDAAFLRARVRNLGIHLGLNPTHEDFYDALIRRFVDELPEYKRITFPQLVSVESEVSINDFSLADQQKIFDLSRYCGFNPQQRPDQLAELCLPIGRYGILTRMAAGDARLYDALLRRDSVNVMLLDNHNPTSNTIAWLLIPLPQWHVLYLDYKNTLLVRDDGIHNQRLLADPLNEAVYRDENTRLISQGYALCSEDDLRLQAQGFEMLLQADFDLYNPWIYDAINRVGWRLGRLERARDWLQTTGLWSMESTAWPEQVEAQLEVNYGWSQDALAWLQATADWPQQDRNWLGRTRDYCFGRYQRFKDYIDSGERFGRIQAFNNIITCCAMLSSFGVEPDGTNYVQQRAHYVDMLKEFFNQDRSLFWN
ncbi:MAG: hypothetical protein JW936_09065 [Sedimentisphaerales bacterium]|nr:hypothetical protein [Sedimentisphaerales bacterium]